METNFFADMVESDLDADTVIGSDPGFLRVAADFARSGNVSERQRRDTPVVDCPKCRGTGRFVSFSGRMLGNCFKCDGSGKTKGLHMDSESVARRAVYKAKQIERKANEAADLQNRREAFAAQHQDVLQWIDAAAARGFEFAVSLRASLLRYGSLTENQVAAVRRSIQKSQERREAAAANAPSVAGEGFQRLLASFKTAIENGLKAPKIRIGTLTFSPAKAASQNAGFLYVKANGEYSGKISPEGRLFACSHVDQATKDLIARVGQDPLAEAVAHGKATGECSCCGRELTDPASIAAGIGPICAKKFGW
jgi:hypothetical protein